MEKQLIDQAQRDIKRADLFPQMFDLLKEYYQCFKDKCDDDEVPCNCERCALAEDVLAKAKELL